MWKSADRQHSSFASHGSKQWELSASPSCCITCYLAADSEEDEAETPKTEKQTVWDWELLNDNKAIWLRSPSDVSEEEYNKFFKAVSKASSPAGSFAFMSRFDLLELQLVCFWQQRLLLTVWRHCVTWGTWCCPTLGILASSQVMRGPRQRLNPGRKQPACSTERCLSLQSSADPLAFSHFKAEGDIEFKSVLFIPPTAPMDFLNNFYETKPQLRLYVRRVFISDDFEELMPK